MSETCSPVIFDFSEIEFKSKALIAQNINNIRLDLDITQKVMANKLKVSVSQYRKYEAQLDTPPLHIAARFFLMTGAPIHNLFSGSGIDFGMPAFESNRELLPFYFVTANLSYDEFMSFMSLIRSYSRNKTELKTDRKDSVYWNSCLKNHCCPV